MLRVFCTGIFLKIEDSGQVSSYLQDI